MCQGPKLNWKMDRTVSLYCRANGRCTGVTHGFDDARGQTWLLLRPRRAVPECLGYMAMVHYIRNNCCAIAGRNIEPKLLLSSLFSKGQSPNNEHLVISQDKDEVSFQDEAYNTILDEVASKLSDAVFHAQNHYEELLVHLYLLSYVCEKLDIRNR
ncbi:hypothetical protein VTN96DRAFT_5542 [Rasamsonia emersonii]